MSDVVHVFVSSTWLDLQPERKAVETALQRMKETKLIGMEYFGSRDDSSHVVSLDEVDRSQFYIGIIAARYGSGITEAEYRRARQKGLTCRIYFKAEAAIIDDHREQDSGKAAKLDTLKTELRHDHTIPEFTSPDDLAARVTADFHNWLIESKRATRADFIPVDISRIDKYAPSELIGREQEAKLLNGAWAKVQAHEPHRPHVLTFVALGGEGKTSLVAKWAADLAAQDWPGCDAAFAWSFYSQGTRDQTAVSSDLFLAEALKFFGDPVMAGSAQSAHDKGRRLAQLVGERRALLILDGLEPLQYPPGPPMDGKLKDEGLAELLKGLAANNHGLCVVTTRYSIPDLRAYWQTTAPEIKLARLSRDAGMNLLLSFGVQGSLRKTIPSTDGREFFNEYEKLVEDVKGHALTLNLLGSYLRDAHDGDIRRRDLIKLEEADAEEQGGHAFHVMDAYVKSFESGGKSAEDTAKGWRALALLRLLGLFDRPATADCLEALWNGEAIPGLTEPLIGISEAQRNLSLKRLEDAKLLTVNRDASHRLVSLDAHPLLREYFAKQLRGRDFQPVSDPGNDKLEAYLTSAAWRAAHRRLYEHLCATTQEGDQPTLEDLQPLYQAVAHGCQAGLQQDALYTVYINRILRRDKQYSRRKLGVFGSELGAIACFFEFPWSRLSQLLKDYEQSLLLNGAAYSLRALGRLTEALEPQRAGLDMGVKQGDWRSATRQASNLSELELTLGEVAGAVGDAEQSVTYADRSGEEGWKMITRTTHADALHETGRRNEAEARFREAEQMQAERQPEYPLLYGLAGFWYCDLLMTEAERAAWQTFMASGGRQPTDISGSLVSRPEESVGLRPPLALKFVECCRAVSERGMKMFEWRVPGDPILDIALDHLTLGRAALYAAILQQSEISDLQLEIEQAVSGLHRAGTTHHIPRGLLTRAWLRSLTGPHIGPESAQSDLDEAWEIAERGPMPLFLADIHLYRARLFGRQTEEGGLEKYPWDKHPDGSARGPQDDLAEARRLIKKHGYGRRLEELADAEAALRDRR